MYGIIGKRRLYQSINTLCCQINRHNQYKEGEIIGLLREVMNVGKYKLRLVLWVAIFMFFSSACAFAAGADTTLFPSQLDVELTKTWTIQFSDSINLDSVSPDRIKVINSLSGDTADNPPPEIGSDGKSVVLKPPVAGYEPGVKYTVIIDGVESTAGKKLSRPVKKGFITAPPDKPAILGQVEKRIENHTVANEVTYRDQLTVAIPANVAGADAKLTIQEVSGAKQHEYSGLGTYATYDIELDRDFIGELTLRFKYDPVFLNPAFNPEEQIRVAYLDEREQKWVETDYSVDPSSREIIVSTDHLSPWSLFTSWVPINAPHFRLYYNNEINAPLLVGAVADPDWIQDPLTRYVLETRSGFIDAYDVLNKNGLVPPEMTNVYINDYGPEETPYYEYSSGDIIIPNNLLSVSELRHACAHELFHAIQNGDLTAFEMDQIRWWVEATADYAAAELMGTRRYVPITASFLENSLGNIVEKEFHEYRSARFVDYLVRHQGIGFKDLWNHTVDEWTTDMVSVISSYLKNQKNAQFSSVFRDYIRKIVIDPENILFDKYATPYQLSTKAEMPLTAKELSESFSLPKYSAKLWSLKPEISSAAKKRHFYLGLESDLPPGVFADIFVLKDNEFIKPEPAAILEKADSSVKITVEPEQMLFVLISNSTDATNSVTVKVKEPVLTVRPDTLETQSGESNNFTLETRNIPEEYEEVILAWDFGDGETKDNDNLSCENEILPVTDGQTVPFIIDHKYMRVGDFELVVRMMDPIRGSLLAEAKAAISIPQDGVTATILPGDIVYNLTAGETEVTLDFEAVISPVDRYLLTWKFGHGEVIYDYFSKCATVSHTYPARTGSYTVQLTVTGLDGFNPTGTVAQKSITVTIGTAESDAGCGLPASAYSVLPREYRSTSGGSEIVEIYGMAQTESGGWTTEDKYGSYKKYIDGVLRESGCYADRGQKYGLWQYFNADSTKYKEERYTFGGLLHGTCTEWYSENNKKTETEYEYDEKHGSDTKWYENGIKEYEFHYIAGKKHGLHSGWYPNGLLKYEMHFNKGERDGAFKRFYDSGLLQREAEYKDGLLHGVAKTYSNTGGLTFEGEFNMNRAVGQHKHYLDSKLYRVQDYDTDSAYRIVYKDGKEIKISEGIGDEHRTPFYNWD